MDSDPSKRGGPPGRQNERPDRLAIGVGRIVAAVGLGLSTAIWISPSPLLPGRLDARTPGELESATLRHLEAARWASADPDRAPPRLLRALPGIGRTRARDIADERHARGGRFRPEAWASLAGIGEGTLGRVLEQLERPPLAGSRLELAEWSEPVWSPAEPESASVAGPSIGLPGPAVGRWAESGRSPAVPTPALPTRDRVPGRSDDAGPVLASPFPRNSTNVVWTRRLRLQEGPWPTEHGSGAVTFPVPPEAPRPGPREPAD